MDLDQYDLARRLKNGDPSVLKELETDVWPLVRWRIERRFAGRLRRADLPDLLQQTLWTLWRSRANYDAAKGSVSSWFAGIACNAAKDLAGRGWLKQREKERATELLAVAAPAPPHDLLADDGAGRDGAESRVVRLRACLANMTQRRRQILFACRACDGDPPSSRELAAELGITPEAVRQELHRAESMVRRHFGPLGLGQLDNNSSAASDPSGGGD